MAIAELTAATFDTLVLKGQTPTFVDFWAPWCGPCRFVAPIVEELSQEYVGKVNFYKLNTDEHGEIAVRYGIRGIPTMIIFKNGKEAGRIVGALPKLELKKRLDIALNAPVA